MYRVILVDDEPWALAGLEQIVNWNEYGFEICGLCSSSPKALRLLEQCDADAVFTDIRMPRMDGLELVSAIKQQKPEAECVIVSAYSDFEVARKAMGYRVAGYILKPLEKDEVSDMLQTLKARMDNKKREPLFINPEDEKSLGYLSSHLSRITRGSYYCVVLSMSPIKTDESADSPELVEIKIKDAAAYSYFYASTEKNPDITRLGENLTRSMWHENCSELAAMIWEAAAAGNGQFFYADHPLVASIQFYIGRNYGAEFSLVRLAHQFFISESYLCELFKKHTGDTVINFTNKVKMQNARRILMHTDISLKEAAQEAGFSDYGYFGRSFKRSFGITPDLLRKMIRNGNRLGPDFPFPSLKWQNCGI
jgi:two-component system response regulator YesN